MTRCVLNKLYTQAATFFEYIITHVWITLVVTSLSLWRSHNPHLEGSIDLTWPRGNGNLACDGRKGFSLPLSSLLRGL